MSGDELGYAVTPSDTIGVFVSEDTIIMDMDRRSTLPYLTKVMGREPDELGMGEIESDEMCAVWRMVTDDEVQRATLFVDIHS